VHPAWRSRRWLTLWACCALGYLSHILLDAATSYGTQLLWPFSRHRAGWDVIAIIDPVVTLALLIGLTWALLKRRVAPVAVALIGCGSYIGWGALQHARASTALHRVAAARGHTVVRFEAMPTLANNVVWRALYLHEGQIFSDRIRVGWFSPATVREGWSLPQVREQDLAPGESVRNQRRSFQRFAWFSEHWVARSPTDPSVVADMRYSLSIEAFDPIWGIRFNPVGQPAEVSWINRTRNRQINAGELWREIRGHDPRFRAVP
jgi:inner membrane protein